MTVTELESVIGLLERLVGLRERSILLMEMFVRYLNLVLCSKQWENISYTGYEQEKQQSEYNTYYFQQYVLNTRANMYLIRIKYLRLKVALDEPRAREKQQQFVEGTICKKKKKKKEDREEEEEEEEEGPYPTSTTALPRIATVSQYSSAHSLLPPTQKREGAPYPSPFYELLLFFPRSRSKCNSTRWSSGGDGSIGQCTSDNYAGLDWPVTEEGTSVRLRVDPTTCLTLSRHITRQCGENGRWDVVRGTVECLVVTRKTLGKAFVMMNYHLKVSETYHIFMFPVLYLPDTIDPNPTANSVEQTPGRKLNPLLQYSAASTVVEILRMVEETMIIEDLEEPALGSLIELLLNLGVQTTQPRDVTVWLNYCRVALSSNSLHPDNKTSLYEALRRIVSNIKPMGNEYHYFYRQHFEVSIHVTDRLRFNPTSFHVKGCGVSVSKILSWPENNLRTIQILRLDTDPEFSLTAPGSCPTLRFLGKDPGLSRTSDPSRDVPQPIHRGSGQTRMIRQWCGCGEGVIGTSDVIQHLNRTVLDCQMTVTELESVIGLLERLVGLRERSILLMEMFVRYLNLVLCSEQWENIAYTGGYQLLSELLEHVPAGNVTYHRVYHADNVTIFSTVLDHSHANHYIGRDNRQCTSDNYAGLDWPVTEEGTSVRLRVDPTTCLTLSRHITRQCGQNGRWDVVRGTVECLVVTRRTLGKAFVMMNYHLQDVTVWLNYCRVALSSNSLHPDNKTSLYEALRLIVSNIKPMGNEFHYFYRQHFEVSIHVTDRLRFNPTSFHVKGCGVSVSKILSWPENNLRTIQILRLDTDPEFSLTAPGK
eukprot:sb/3462123/